MTRPGTARARRSARGRARYGVGLRPTWRTANYAYPAGIGSGRRAGRPSYPIDPRHVRAALSRSAQRGTAGNARRVRWAVRQRYGSVPAALAAASRAGRRH